MNVPALARSAVGITAVREVPETKVVARATPAHFTVAPVTKLVPVMVMVVSPAPLAIEFGARDDMVGVGFEIVTTDALLVGVPGPGLTTVTLNVPAAVRSVVGTTAVIDVAETLVVANATPPHATLAPTANPVPVTVIVVALAPTVAVFGATDDMVGVTLDTVKVTPELVGLPGPGLTTLMVNVPAAVRSAAGTTALNAVAEVKVVATPLPFHWTSAPVIKPVPVRLMVVLEAPAVAVVVSLLVRTGAELVTVNVAPKLVG